MNKRTVFWSIIGGIVVAQSLVVWLAPMYLVWYFTPPAQTGFDCSLPISWALTRMQSAILYSILVGAVLGIICAWVFRQKSVERQ